MAMPPTERGTRRDTKAASETLTTAQQVAGADTPGVIETMYRAEAGNLTRYFGRKLRGHDEAADYVHEAFARLVRIMSAQPILQPHRYLRRIARNLLFERGRRLRHRPPFLDGQVLEGPETAIAPQQSHRLEYDDMARAYRQALNELPTKTKEVFLLHRVDELAYREIGQRLGISIPTVQYHMARALAHIDAALGQE